MKKIEEEIKKDEKIIEVSILGEKCLKVMIATTKKVLIYDFSNVIKDHDYPDEKKEKYGERDRDREGERERDKTIIISE